MAGEISRQRADHRSGVVLGLTMAEILLLLLFCMLVAVAASLGHERDRRVEAEEKALRLETANAELALVAEEVQRLVQVDTAAADEEIDDLWTRLVEADAIVTRAETQGLPRAALAEDPGFFAAADRLRRDGVTRGDLAAPTALEALTGGSRDNAATGPHAWPPIISLSEAEGFFFASGSAELSPGFRDALSGPVAARIAEILLEYDVDVVEVVGHTDEVPIAPRPSNLDRLLIGVAAGGGDVSGLIPGDNAGLGLARAVSVARLLGADPRLSGARVLPLTAGQLVGTDENLTLGSPGGAQERRRIEIRVRRGR